MLTYRKWTDGAKGSGSFVDNCKHNGLVLHPFINWLTSSQRRNSLAASGTHMTLRGVFDRPDLLSGEVISQLDTWSASPSGSSHGVCGGGDRKTLGWHRCASAPPYGSLPSGVTWLEEVRLAQPLHVAADFLPTGICGIQLQRALAPFPAGSLLKHRAGLRAEPYDHQTKYFLRRVLFFFFTLSVIQHQCHEFKSKL